MSGKPDTLKVPTQDLFHLASESVARFGRFSFVARGFSMQPAIADQEKVTLGPATCGDLRIGDIVLCNTAEGPRLHRVVEQGKDARGTWVVIRGDGRGSEPHTVRDPELAGKVTHVRRSLPRRLKLLLRPLLRRD